MTCDALARHGYCRMWPKVRCTFTLRPQLISELPPNYPTWYFILSAHKSSIHNAEFMVKRLNCITQRVVLQANTEVVKQPALSAHVFKPPSWPTVTGRVDYTSAKKVTTFAIINECRTSRAPTGDRTHVS